MTPSDIAKTLYDGIHKKIVDNAYWEDDKLIPCKTTDYTELFKLTESLVTSPQALTGSCQEVPTTALVKLIFNGDFTSQLHQPGDSVENYKMILAIYEATSEEKDFWENPEEISQEKLTSQHGYIFCIAGKPAASLAAQRMEMETFALNIHGNGPEALEAATKLAEKLKNVPAFQNELRGLQKLCSLQEVYDNTLQGKTDVQTQIQTTARAIARKDFHALASWKSGDIGLQLDAAVKLHLFLGKSGSPILDRAVEKAREPLRSKNQEHELETA